MNNSHVNSVCEKVSFHSMFIYFHCSTGNIYKYEGKYLFRRISHASDGCHFNPFAIPNKQAHIIGGNLPELRYGELGFSLTQVSR